MRATECALATAVGLAAAMVAPAPLSADESFEEGLRLFDSGRYTRALERFGASSDRRAPALASITGAALGRCGEELPALKAAAAGEDETVSRLAGLAAARCWIADQEFDAALGMLSALKERHPTDPDILYEGARLHLKGWNEAVAEMFGAAPASFRVNQLSAEIFEIQGRFDEAVSEYRKAIQKAPGTINLHYRLGRALLMRSHDPAALQDALSEFRAELELNPNDAAAEFQVGQILQVTGKPAEAAAHFEKAVALDAEFPEALVALAKDRIRDERFDEAIGLLERALQLRPASEPAHYSLMLAYRNAGRRDDAERVRLDLERLQAPTEGEFSDFLKRIGESQ